MSDSFFAVRLLVGSLAVPLSGRLADRIGVGRLMASLSLALPRCRLGDVTFAIALAFTQNVSAAVLYATTFAAIVQTGRRTAWTSIVDLTLIAGFASSPIPPELPLPQPSSS